jgi:outer membrane receptor protein involved in Fe transport
MQSKAESVQIPRYSALATAISAVVSGTATAADAPELEELIVTASKRGDVNVQDLASSVQVIGNEELKTGQLFSLEDYSRFIPSMTYFGNNPGAGKIFFRGVADAPDTFIAPSSAAIYLDEQPLTQNAQVDVRMIDIERVEALAGPQGTLFGSSAQSGTLRIITNKPDPQEFHAFADVTLSGTEEGDPSYDVAGMLNIPLVEDKVALRLVGFTATQGGFIDNVAGPTPISASGYGRVSVTGQQFNDGTIILPGDSEPSANPDPGVVDVTEKDWNESTTTGGRIALRWNVVNNWTGTLSAAFQNNESDAESTYDRTIGDLQVVAFSADTHEDDWAQFALTIEGDMGWANFVSATSYFTRDTKYNQDTASYTAYFGTFCYDATANYNIYCFQPAGVNYTYNDPIGFLVNDQENTSFSQEFRLSHEGERIDWLAGVFWEQRTEEWVFDTFTTNTGGYSESQSMDNWTTNYWNVPADTTTDAWWRSVDDTEWTTLAVFGELTFHFTDKFSGTVGGRWFDVEMDKTYYVELPKGRITPALKYLDGVTGAPKWGCVVADAPCNALDSDNPNDTGISTPDQSDDDFALKLALQYAITENHMVYGLYSEGFRPGGVNRNRGNPFFPAAFSPDYLTNYEFGAKTTWWDNRLLANLTVFFMEWEDYQLEVVDPSNLQCSNPNAPAPPFCGQPWQKVVTNVGNASSDGVELSLQLAATEGLDIGANVTYIDATLDEDVPALDDVKKGDKLPFAPEWKASGFVQYNWPMRFLGAKEMFARWQISYTDDSFNQVQTTPIEPLANVTPQVTMESYSVSDIKLGLVADAWEVDLFVTNVGDERGQTYHDNTDFEYFWGNDRTSVIRPRSYGLRVIYNW